MKRRTLTLRLAAADVPNAEALLDLAGAESLALRDAGDDPVLEPRPGETPLWPGVEIRALFSAEADLDALQRLLERSCPSVTALQVASFDDDAWRRAAQRGFPARRFGERLWLASAEETDVPRGLAGVRLHMGLAFGTGEHPTTALCLDWLAATLRPGAIVLDYGCGSGVLAIAALALGASAAWAVDNDEQALVATRENAELNGCSRKLFVGLPESLPALRVDVVLANILAGPLIALAPTFAGALAAGGSMVLSGVLARQAAEVASAYDPYFERIANIERDGWARLEGARRSE